MFVSQWMKFTDSYRGEFKGYGCEVLATRAEGSRLLILIDNGGTLDVNANDVQSVRIESTTQSELDRAERYHNSMAWGR